MENIAYSSPPLQGEGGVGMGLTAIFISLRYSKLS